MVFTGEIQSEKTMTVQVPDRFKAANAFWIGLTKIGLTPAAVLTKPGSGASDGLRRQKEPCNDSAVLRTLACRGRAFFRSRRRPENCHTDRRWESAAVNDGGLLRPRLPGCPYSPCPLQAIVYARGVANQDGQGRVSDRARVATRAGRNAVSLGGRRLCLLY